MVTDHINTGDIRCDYLPRPGESGAVYAAAPEEPAEALLRRPDVTAALDRMHAADDALFVATSLADSPPATQGSFITIIPPRPGSPGRDPVRLGRRRSTNAKISERMEGTGGKLPDTIGTLIGHIVQHRRGPGQPKSSAHREIFCAAFNSGMAALRA